MEFEYNGARHPRARNTPAHPSCGEGVHGMRKPIRSPVFA